VKQHAPIWKEEHYADGDSRYLDGVPLKRKDETPA
jgi:molybdopterin synthase catalytic subunit